MKAVTIGPHIISGMHLEARAIYNGISFTGHGSTTFQGRQINRAGFTLEMSPIEAMEAAFSLMSAAMKHSEQTKRQAQVAIKRMQKNMEKMK